MIASDDGLSGWYALLRGRLRPGEPVELPVLSGSMAPLLPIGSRLRILPNHACATGAQFPEYHCRMENGECQTWPRLHGW